MSMYKVQFKNNLAVNGMKVPIAAQDELKELGVDGSKLVIRWCIVDAEHENEALEIANKMVKYVWGSILG
jgi:hypothetical protein